MIKTCISDLYFEDRSFYRGHEYEIEFNVIVNKFMITDDRGNLGSIPFYLLTLYFA